MDARNRSYGLWMGYSQVRDGIDLKLSVENKDLGLKITPKRSFAGAVVVLRMTTGGNACYRRKPRYHSCCFRHSEKSQ